MKAGRRLVLAALPLLVTGCAPASVTSEGRATDDAYRIFLIAAAVVFGIVAVWLLWSVVRYRRRNDELPNQTHGSPKLELLWTVLPLGLVIFLFVVTMRAQSIVLHDPPSGITVDVIAFQWSWQFDYEGTDKRVIGGPNNVPEMVVPVGVPVHIKLRSTDVVHSFYVPRALFKRQAIPGTTNQFDMDFQRVGIYHGQCAQFCGVAHSDMLFRIRVVSQNEFQRFLTGGRGGPPTGRGT
ncbi:MAG TPA: cytochrome c oxidase subunit II [Actinomycetes bacterium]|nr:cytochrome c oxidase subunit II [Actinomycetes bacterium]